MGDDGSVEFGCNLSIQIQLRYIELYTDHHSNSQKATTTHKRLHQQKKGQISTPPKAVPSDNTNFEIELNKLKKEEKKKINIPLSVPPHLQTRSYMSLAKHELRKGEKPNIDACACSTALTTMTTGTTNTTNRKK